ncbi:MAG: tyrosine-type recombinase/integrase [Nitrososphaeraceae archaeon]|nr:tyrosine-type recombinase/integrase [Nitrososphaeraceae archaeon]
MMSSQLAIKYINNVKSMSNSTAQEYKNRLHDFAKFVYKTYQCNIDNLIHKILNYDNQNKETNLNPYDVLSSYAAYLTGTIAPITIKQRVVTAKNFFEYCDIEVSVRKFKFKVKLPRAVQKEKKALSKSDVTDILNTCSNVRLKTYVMLLAATGMRASEVISVRICDLDLDSIPPKLYVRGEYTKTRSDRTVLLTQEIAKQLRNWLEYKFRKRRVSFYDKKAGKSTSEYRTPPKIDNDLVFSMNASSQGYLSVSIRSMYVELASIFGNTLDRMGRGQREESVGAQHRRITLHSFRRYVYSTISDLGYSDYANFFIGHSGSTYYRKSEKEKIEIFKKIEPYLTFLDYGELERKGADIISQLEEKDKMIQNMVRKQEQFEQLIQSLIDSGQLKPKSLNST